MTRSVGNYKLLQELGEGAMGTVYRALDTQLEREVAMKSLRSELAGRPDIVQRFREEAKLQGRLESMHVVRLYQFLREGDEFFMVMEFVQGKSLGALLREKGRLNPKDAIDIMLQALDGLGYAHKRHIVHRDVKPANIMVSDDGVVKVADFGIARLLGSTRQTKIGSIVGTLEYISPEAVQGRESTAVSDIYSCGVVLYELLSGHLPFSSTNEYELASAHVQTPPPPLRKWITDIPKDLESAIMRALSKKPAERFQSAEQMAQALKRCLPALSGSEVRPETRVFRRFWPSSPRGAEVPPPLPAQDSPTVDGLQMVVREVRSLLERGFPEQAKSAIELSLEQYSGDPGLEELLHRAEAEIAAFQARTSEVKSIATRLSELQKEGRHQEAVAVALDAVARLPNQPEVTALLIGAVKAQKVETCRQQVEGLKKSEDWDGALAAIDQLLKIYSLEPFLLELRQGVEQEREAKRQAKEGAAVLSHVADLQRNGQLDEAERAIGDALVRFKNSHLLSLQFIEVGQALKAARLRKLTAKALIEAREFQKRREWSRALDLLNNAVREAPNDTELMGALSEIEQERDKYLAEVRQAVEGARNLLAAHRFEDALAGLSSAIERYPHEPALKELLLEAEQKLAAERTERQLEQTRTKAADLIARDAFAEAEQLLHDAISRFPQEPRLKVLLSSASRGHEEQKKRGIIEQVLNRAGQMSGQRLFADAIRELDALLVVYPSEPSVERRRQELTHSLREERRAQRVAELRGWSNSHGENFGAALDSVDKALLEYPGDTDLISIRTAIEAGERSFARQKAETDVASQAAELEGQGQFKEALDLAESTKAKYPESEALGGLPAAILRRWEEAYKLRRAGEAEREIRRLLASGNPHAAVAPLDAALAEFPHHEGMRELNLEVQGALREYDSQEAARLVRDAIAHRDWTAAESAVRQFEGKYGTNAIGASLREEASQARKTWQKSLDDTIARVRASLAAKDFVGAIHLIDSLDLREGERETCAALLSAARTGLEGQAFEKRFQDLRDRVSRGLERGEMTSVKDLIASARIEYESYSPFRELEERVRREDGIRLALDKALECVGARAWDKAIEHLESSAKQFGGDRRISDLIGEVRQERQTQAQAERSAALLQAMDAAKALQQQGHFDEAIARLEAFTASYEREPVITDLRQAIEHDREAAQRAAELRDFTNKINELLARGKAEEAIRILGGPSDGIRDHPEIEKLRAVAQVQLDRQKERAAAVDEAIRSAEAFQQQSDFERAAQVLAAFTARYGKEPKLADLERSIKSRREEFERRAEELKELVHRAGGLLEEGKAHQAEQLLESTPAYFTEHPDVARLREQTAIQIRKEAEREAALRMAISSSLALELQERFEEALTSVQTFVLEHGPDRRIGEREKAINSAREAAHRAGNIRELASRARSLLDEGNVQGALALLQGAPSLVSESQELRELRKTAEARLAVEEKQEAIRAILSRVRSLESGGEFGAALKAIDEGLKRFPSAVELQSLRPEIATAEAARQIEELRARTVTQIRSLAAKHDYDRAFQVWEDSQSKLSGDEQIRQLKIELEAERNRWVEAQTEETIQESLRQARELLTAQPAEAVGLLQRLCAQFPDRPELGNQLAQAREALLRSQELRLIQEADQLCAWNRFEEALAKISQASRDTPELASARQQVESRRGAAEKELIANAIRAARETAKQNPSRALPALEKLQREFPNQPTIAQAIAESRAAIRESDRQSAIEEMQGLCAKGKFSKARALHQKTVARFGSDTGLEQVLARIEESATVHPTRLAEPAPASRARKALMIAGICAAAIAGFGTWILSRHTKPVLIHLAVTTDPSGASVRLGDQSCKTPNCRIDVAPGSYTIQVQLEGYQPTQRTVTLDPGLRDRSEDITLQRVALPERTQPVPLPLETGIGTGTLLIQAGLPEVLVFVDGVSSGRTDARGTLSIPLEAKIHSIRVQKPGYDAPGELQVRITKNVSQPAIFTLTPQMARLELRGAPAGAEVRADDILTGRTDGLQTYSVRIKPGDHVLRIALGAAQGELKRTFEPGGTVTLAWADFGMVTPTIVPPPHQITDCKDPAYTGVHYSRFTWNGVIEPDSERVIDGSQVKPRFPGCEITVTAITAGIMILEQPSRADGYQHVKIRNSSRTVLGPVELRWQEK
jgi:serine/threonine protein kinase